jgi:hypothetical protein
MRSLRVLDWRAVGATFSAHTCGAVDDNRRVGRPQA